MTPISWKQDDRVSRAGSRSCYRCKFLLHETESWEMQHIAWWECAKKPSVANLSSFPFLNTKCNDWKHAGAGAQA